MKLPEARSSGLFLVPLLPMGGPIIGKLTDVAMRNWIKTDKWFEGCSRRDACLSATVNGMAYCKESCAPRALHDLEIYHFGEKSAASTHVALRRV
jgi:hypothetical protein